MGQEHVLWFECLDTLSAPLPSFSFFPIIHLMSQQEKSHPIPTNKNEFKLKEKKMETCAIHLPK